MKITHLCLCGPFTDNFSYQENLLTKYHRKLGFEVSVITSQYIYNKNGQLNIDDRSVYRNEYGIKVIRLRTLFNTSTNFKFKRYKGLYKSLNYEKPDIIFIHGLQFLDIKKVVLYLKRNPDVKVFVDNHADFSNSATNWLSKNILHKLLWRKMAHLINPYTERFYGVLPARVDFLNKIYKLPSDKIELLLMGADDEKVKEAKNKDIRKNIRKKHKIKDDDFLIVTGGKIDNAKRQTLLLMKAIKQIKNENIKLIVFGSIIKELEKEVKSLADGKKIQYIGWMQSEDCYKIFAAADLGVFPGRHSVLWEQAVGTGLPCIFKYWHGTTHVDLGGNCEFIYNDSIEEIITKINKIVNNRNLYNKMRSVAESRGMSRFSYYEIAKLSIGIKDSENYSSEE